MAFSISTDIVNTYNEVADALINDLGVNCLLVYPELRQQCVNCFTRTLGVGSSANVYRPGGPIPFQQGRPCPLCNGKGFKLVENTETIKMRVYYSPKEWVKIAMQIKVPDKMIQTIFFLSDIPKVMKAKHLMPDKHLHGYVTPRYTRMGDPSPHGFLHDRYVVVFWERVG